MSGLLIICECEYLNCTFTSEVQLLVEKETAGSVCLFSALVSAIERSQAQLLEVMDMTRRATQHQANAIIRQLELEVEELRSRESALHQLTQSDNYVHCVKVGHRKTFAKPAEFLFIQLHPPLSHVLTGQTFANLSVPPPTKDWSAVTVNPDLGTNGIYRTLLVEVEKFQEELRNAAEKGWTFVRMYEPERQQLRLKRAKRLEVSV